METNSVLVEYTHKEDRVYANSGILIDRKYVIITPSVLAPALNNQPNIKQKLNSLRPGFQKPQLLLDTLPPINVVIEEGSGDGKRTCYKEGALAAMFISECIKTSYQKLLCEWAIDCDETEFQMKEILPLFFILEIDGDGQTDLQRLNRCLHEVWLAGKSCNVRVGNKVFIESTPFGNRNFLKSYSRGIVSNIMGDNECLFLTDTPTAPGSEGSPIYLKLKSKKKMLFGVVISSLCWWKGEWIGLTLGANLATLVENLILPSSTVVFENVPQHKKLNNLIDILENCLAQVISGSSWGTAILMNKEKGMFLTNAHVIETENPTLYWREHKMEAKVLFRSTITGAYDLAVLICKTKQLQDTTMKSVPISLTTPCKGDKVYAGGFPLFSRDLRPKPTLTSGHVSQVNDCIIKTTCPVLPGASGGAIFRPDGLLTGVIVCNTRIKDNAIAYPRVNMSIPILAIYEVMARYIKTGDPKCLQRLQTEDVMTNKVWNLIKGKL